MKKVRYSLLIKGIVQGVGFRPYVFRLANLLSISGFVKNTSEGVYAEIEGEAALCDSFINEIKQHPPALAQVKNIQVQKQEPIGEQSFAIIESSSGIREPFISPDIGICDACAAEITDKNNRRYNYAFTNCTDCGPRFTIIRDIPYDRSNTTMAQFVQCPNCSHEYEDPYNRRFHAQPNACPVCGPRLYFYVEKELRQGDPYALFDECIKKGGTVAVKGLGGYHLVCDAKNEEAVARLRKNKIRYDKPFAVMMRDVETVKNFCHVNAAEESILSCVRKPIVLLKKKENCKIAEQIAPRNGSLGVMLPYTPLHLTVMHGNDVLVMTSANLSDRPMIYDDDEALRSLFDCADAVLTNDRPIFRRMDDSVCMVVSGKTRLIRRARGYAPEPVKLKGNNHTILALGAQQKNTFCLAKGENAFLSGHIGDLDDMDTEKCYESEIESYMRLFDAKPDIIVCDMHPDYVSTRFANRYKHKSPIYQIQHHHAHFASVLAEHGVENNAIGFVFDGTGYGEDGAIWGGEALWGGVSTSCRIGHMLYAPLLGGEAAIREPWRMALAMMRISCGEEAALSYFEDHSGARLLLSASDRGINSPMTSSAGRLFDAAAALAGIRTHTTFEGQAAIDLEQAIDDLEEGSYGIDVVWESNMMIFDWRQLIRDIASDVIKGYSSGKIAAKFHRAVVQLLVDAAYMAKKQYGSSSVILSGGVFQNAYILQHVFTKLSRNGFDVFSNEIVPANDGGISYGQAAAVSRLIENEMR
jgi:hydrogenase maturation protein HypF